MPNKPRFQGTAKVPKEKYKVDLFIEKKFDNVCDLWYVARKKKKYLLRNQSYQDCYNEALSYVTGGFQDWVKDNLDWVK